MSSWYRCRCRYRWQPQPPPQIGERVICPACGEYAMRDRDAAEEFSEHRRDPWDRPRAPVEAGSRSEKPGAPAAAEIVIERDGRRPFAVITVIGCVLMLVGAALLWPQYSKSRSRVEYYREWTWKFGMPAGIDRIDESTLVMDNFGVRFTYKGDFLEQIEYLDALMQPIERYSPESVAFDNDMPWCQFHESKFAFAYNPDGSVARETVTDRFGILLYQVMHDSPKKVRFVNPNGQPYHCPRHGASAARFEWSSAGFQQEIFPLHYTGNDQRDNAFAKIYCTYDARGVLLREEYQDARGNPVQRYPRGYAGFEVRYGSDLSVIRFTALGVDGKPQKTFRQFASATFRRDAGGRSVTRYFDEHDAPTRCHQEYARCDRYYDSTSHITREEYFDEQDRATNCRDGFASFSAVNDYRGNATTIRYYDVQERPVLLRDGYHRIDRDYDFRNRLTMESFSDTREQRIVTKLGYAERRLTYDFFGFQDGEAYLGANNERILVNGRASWKSMHDVEGRTVAMWYLGADNRPILMPDGYSSWTAKYSESGRSLETCYFGPDDKPIRSKLGYAVVRWNYDDKDQMTEEAYFDEIGQPCIARDGAARVTHKRDASGSETAYFGVRNEPIVSKLGYARFVYRHDEKKTESAFFDADGKPIMVGGFARMLSVVENHRTVREYFDAGGKLVNQRDGVARTISVRDKNHIEIECTHFGANNRPALNSEGWHKATRSATPNGRIASERYHDTHGDLAPMRLGYARKEWHYDDGRLKCHEFFDSQGRKLPAQIVVESLEPDTDIAKSGIQAGDILVRYAGKSYESSVKLFDFLESESSADPPRSVVVRRGDKELTLMIPPACFDINWINQAPVERLRMPRDCK